MLHRHFEIWYNIFECVWNSWSIPIDSPAADEVINSDVTTHIVISTMHKQ